MVEKHNKKEKKRKKENEILSKGSVVEVSSDEDGFRGVWFLATVLEPPFSTKNRKGTALIQYQSLLSDDGQSLLTENVDACFIRPLPPETKQSSFELHDVVDALYNEGWWKGVVTKVSVLEDQNNTKSYTVVFNDPPDQLDFGLLALRVHLDWMDEKWVRPPKQQRMEGLKFSTGMNVEVNLGTRYPDDQWFPATVLEELGFNSFLVECSSLSNSNENGFMKETVDSFHIRPPPPDLGAKNLEILEPVDAFYGSGWRVGFIMKILKGDMYMVSLKHTWERAVVKHPEIRPHMHLTNGNWVCIKDILTTYSQERSEHGNITNAGITDVTSPEQCSKSCKAKQREVKKAKQSACKSEATHSYLSMKFKKENSTITKNADSSLASQACQIELMPIQIPNEKVEVASGKLSKCSNHHMACSMPSADKSPIRGGNVEINQEEAGLAVEMMVSMEDRGHPSNTSIESQYCRTAGEFDNTKKDSSKDRLDIEHITKVHSSVAIAKEMTDVHAENSCDLGDKEINQEQAGLDTEMMVSMEDRGQQPNACIDSLQGLVAGELDTTKKDSSKDFVDIEHVREEVHLSVVIAEGMTDDALAENLCDLVDKEFNGHEENDDTNEQQKGEEHILTGVCANKIDCEDCATEKVDLPTMSMEPAGPNSGKTINQQNDTGDRQVETLTHCPLTKVSVNSEHMEYQGMPFVKKSSIWGVVESLNVFQIMPQNPHFHPLGDFAKAVRERLAIGHMVTFAASIEEASKLKVDDPKSTFESLLEALAELELHGFDVKAVVDCLNNLLSIKDRQGQLQDQSKKVQIEIAEHTHYETTLEDDISIEKKICELEEKRALIRSMKEHKKSEITALKMQARVIGVDIGKGNCEFESIAASVLSKGHQLTCSDA